MDALARQSANQEEQSDSAGSLRELLRVAVPLILSSGSLSLMNVIDRILLTWYTTEALAAAMPAGMLYWSFASLAMGIASYVNTFVAQYEGAGRKDRVAAALWQGAYLALVAGSLLTCVAPFSQRMFEWIGHGPEVRALEAQYFGILCLGGIPLLLSQTLACFFSGRGQTTVILWINLTTCAINGVFDYLLIFGVGPFPHWGIAGAAAATVFAQVCGTATYIVLLLRPRINHSYHIWRNRGFDRELFRRLLRYGFPNGLLYLVDIAGFAIFIFLIGWIGDRELAATSLAFNLNSLAFIPMWGLGIAVSTLVGTRIGEGRPELAVRTAWLGFAVGGTYMLTFALIYVLLPDLILLPYAAKADPVEFAEIRSLVVMLLRFVAFYSFFDAMGIVFGSAIRGAGDTRFSMIYTLITVTCLLILPTYIAWKFYEKSLLLSWTACTVYAVSLGIGFLARFQTGHWKSMRVIEHFPTEDLADTEPAPPTPTPILEHCPLGPPQQIE